MIFTDLRNGMVKMLFASGRVLGEGKSVQDRLDTKH